MFDWIVEEFANRHEVMEIGIPTCWIVHAAYPFLVVDMIDQSHQPVVGAVIDCTEIPIWKQPGLPSSAKGVDPIERYCEETQQPRKGFRRPSREMRPKTGQRKQRIQDDKPKHHVNDNFPVSPAGVLALPMKVGFR